MTPLDLGFLTGATLVTSAFTAALGAGGGTALIVIMLMFMPPAAAIPVHGAVQLASNTTRVWLLWRDLSWPLIFRFSLLLVPGSALGLMVFQGLPPEVIKILIGMFVVISLMARRIGRFRDRDLPMWAFYPLGFVAGILNMVVGGIAPILGVLIIRRDLTKEAVVGTLGVFALIGNIIKIAGFTLIGFTFAEYWPAIICMIPAAVIGAQLGRRVLAGMDETWFLLAFRTVLLLLAVKLIVIDGLQGLLAATV